MKYKNIKGTGLKVSEMCLGTMTFGWTTEEEESIRIIDYAFDQGVNFFDTANVYGAGASERIVGQALRDKRQDCVVATKLGGGMGKGPNKSGLGRKNIMQSLDDSLKRLQMDYVDLYYMHFPDDETPIEESMLAMNDLIRAGKIRYYGVSNFSAWQLCSMLHLAKEMNIAAPVITQTVYNPITRGADDELIPLLNKYQVGMAAFNPLAGGLLTGKHTRNQAAADSRFDGDKGYRLRYWNDRNFDAIDLLTKAAADLGISLLELSFRWHLSRPCVDTVISGIHHLPQIEQNILFFEKDPLPEETMKICDDAWGMIHGQYFNYHK